MDRKRIKIGEVKGEIFGYKQDLDLTVGVHLRDDKKGKVLSIVGNIWKPRSIYPLALKGAWEVKEMLQKGDLVKLNIPTHHFFTLLEIWENWHLNNLRPECKHQKELIKKVEINKGEDFFSKDNYEEIIKIPEFNRCPICGHQYDSIPYFKQLPTNVINFIQKFIAKYSNESD